MLATAYLGLIIFIVVLEAARKKETKIDFLSLFHLNFCLAYPLPAFLLDAPFGTPATAMWFNEDFYISNIKTAIAIFLGYFSVLLGFYSKSAIKKGNQITIKSKSKKHILIFAIFLLMFTCISMQIYSLHYGGVLVALAKTNIIRAGGEERGAFTFFKRFLLCSFFSTYLIGSYTWLARNKKHNIYLYGLFIISTTIAIIAFMLNGSRAPLVNFILVFYFGYVLKTGKFSWVFTIGFGWAAAFFIVYGKVFFFSLTALPQGIDAFITKFISFANSQPNSGEFSIYELVKNFAYPIYSLDAALNKVYEPRLLRDWFYAVISIMPEKILNLQNPETVTELNTRYIIGNNDYLIQPGMLAFGIYVMSWPGMIIIAAIYGWLGGYLQRIMYNHLHDIVWMPYVYIFIVQVLMDILVVGDPEVFMHMNIWSVLSISLFLCFYTKILITPKTSFNSKSSLMPPF